MPIKQTQGDENSKGADEVIQSSEKEPEGYKEARQEMLIAIAQETKTKQRDWEDREDLAWMIAARIKMNPELMLIRKTEFLLTKEPEKRSKYSKAWEKFTEAVENKPWEEISDKLNKIEDNRKEYEALKNEKDTLEVTISGTYTPEEVDDAKYLAKTLIKAIDSAAPRKSNEANPGIFILNRKRLPNQTLTCISSKKETIIENSEAVGQIRLPRNTINIGLNGEYIGDTPGIIRKGDTIDVPLFENAPEGVAARIQGHVKIKLGMSAQEWAEKEQEFIQQKKAEKAGRIYITPKTMERETIEKGEGPKKPKQHLERRGTFDGDIKAEEEILVKQMGMIPFSLKKPGGEYEIVGIKMYQIDLIGKQEPERTNMLQEVAEELAKKMVEATEDRPIELLINILPKLCRTKPDIDNSEVTPNTQKFLKDLAPEVEKVLRRNERAKQQEIDEIVTRHKTVFSMPYERTASGGNTVKKRLNEDRGIHFFMISGGTSTNIEFIQLEKTALKEAWERDQRRTAIALSKLLKGAKVSSQIDALNLAMGGIYAREQLSRLLEPWQNDMIKLVKQNYLRYLENSK